MHYAAYKVSGIKTFKKLATTLVETQLGSDIIKKVKAPDILMVPASKSENEYVSPTPLFNDVGDAEHYLCYPVTIDKKVSQSKNEVVTLSDQFIEDKDYQIQTLDYLCTPVVKQHLIGDDPDGPLYFTDAVKDASNHLACYTVKALEGKAAKQVVNTADQFASRQLILKKGAEQRICVPAVKLYTAQDVCGDGIKGVDPVEACDDGNTTNGDGCDSTCNVEAPPSCTFTSDLGSALGTNLVFATTTGQGDDDDPSSCVASSPAPDLRYRWTSPSAGNFIFYTGPFFGTLDSLLYIRDDTCTNNLACNIDASSLIHPHSEICLNFPINYSIAIDVDGFNGSAGFFSLSIAAAQISETSCSDLLDNDCDGLADCSDPDCTAACASCTGRCGFPGITPGQCNCHSLCGFNCCADIDSICEATPAACSDTIDNNGDGLTDCTPNFNAPYCGCPTENYPAVCNDGLDNDGDTLIDCVDPQCVGMPNCENSFFVCTDSLDNDSDTFIDCADPGCAGIGPCPP